MSLLRKLHTPALLIFLALQARPAGKFALTIDNIMRGPALVGYEPSEARWSGDGERIYFQWKQYKDPHDADFDTYVVNRDGTGLRKLNEQETRLAPPASGDMTRDKRMTVYAREGDIFVYDGSTGQTRQVTKTADIEINPHFLRDGKRIYYPKCRR